MPLGCGRTLLLFAAVRFTDGETMPDTRPSAEPPLRLLLVDDSAFDAQLLSERLRRDGVSFTLDRVDTDAAFRAALRDRHDLVLCEIALERFSARGALAVLRGLANPPPLVVVTGVAEETELVDLVREGAIDYVLKTRLGRLTQALRLAVERARLVETLDTKRRKMAALSVALINAQEAERKHLARELHDELGQRLTALNLLLHRAHPHIEAPGQVLWQQAERELSDLVGQVRSMSVSLRPPGLDFFGLGPTIQQLLSRQFAEGVDWVFEYAGLPGRLAAAIEISVYRIVQESVTNIVRHARARHVVVEINGGAAGEELEVIVRDDGAGFDAVRWPEHAASTLSSGLAGMNERVELLGGSFRVDSAPGRGTRVTACLPLVPPLSAPEGESP
jgi:signal transduction histidine kinase